MSIEKELSSLQPQGNTLLTIGVFDGVHLGHQHIISELKRQALKEQLISGVVTFRHHPRIVLSSKRKVTYLNSIEERVAILKELGIEMVVLLSFNNDIAGLSAGEFCALLQKHLRMKGLITGPNFAMGKGREGDTATLKKLGQEMGFTFSVVATFTQDKELISSTTIREALEQGEVKRVNKLLGRTFSLSARVTTGDERGRVLGYPTANLSFNSDRAIPARGVYVTKAFIDKRSYQAVANIGKRPTFGGKKLTIEVFLLDFDENLYDREIRIELIDSLRDEIKFASADELKEQIARDVALSKSILDGINST